MTITTTRPAVMKAAICKEIGKPIVVEEVPVPVPKGRDVLVRVKAASLCHSDVTIVGGSMGSAFLPVIVGHEAVSVIEELGPDAASYGLKVGDVIGAPLWQGMCLSCRDCRLRGQEFCSTGMLTKGITAPGYFSEYTLVDAATAVVVPVDRLEDPAAVGPLFCAGITVWDALSRAKLHPGETVAIVGVGGLGELAAKYAQALGAKVIALDVHDKQLASVKASGSVDEILNTSSLSPAELAAQTAVLNGGYPVDVAIVTTGAIPAYTGALNILRAEGRLVAVGIPTDQVPLSIIPLATKAIQIIGAKVPGRDGAAECLEFSLRKGIFPKIHPRKFQLEDINEMLELMKAGEVQNGRMVVQFF